MKLPPLILSGLLIAPFVMADSDPQQKQFGDGTCLPEFLAQYDVKGPHGPPDGKIDEEEKQAMEQMRKQIRNQERKDIDTDGDGVIGTQEQEHARHQLRLMIEENRLVRFNEADTDGTPGLSYEEFVVLPGMARKIEAGEEARVLEIFDRLDADDDGVISEAEFLSIVRQCDQDRDGSGDGRHTGHGGSHGGGGHHGGGGGF